MSSPQKSQSKQPQANESAKSTEEAAQRLNAEENQVQPAEVDVESHVRDEDHDPAWRRSGGGQPGQEQRKQIPKSP